MDSPYTRAFKKVNSELQKQHNPRRRLPPQAPGREPCLHCRLGRKAYLDLVSSPVSCPFLALCSFPLYRNRAHLALSTRVPQITPPLHHGQALHSCCKDHGQPETFVSFTLQCYLTAATGY